MNILRNGILLAVAGLFVVGCGPMKVELIEEIEPNETAFMIKLEGDSKAGQDKFMSEEFLEESKVATKRVSIPQRKFVTGRLWLNYKWIPTVRVIKVDRSPVTREWTSTEDTGTESRNEAIHLESSGSIAFMIGVNMTASIPQEYATKFLYNFAGKSLEEVVDQNVRGYVATVLSREFGSRDLATGRTEKGLIFSMAFDESKEYFSQKGISVDYLGFSQGMTYEDKEIQDGINRVFTAQMDVKTATQEGLAQAERNALKVAKAIAERSAAQEFAKAVKSATAIRRLEIDLVKAEAQKTAAERWNGQMPANIMPQGSNLLFGMDMPKTK